MSCYVETHRTLCNERICTKFVVVFSVAIVKLFLKSVKFYIHVRLLILCIVNCNEYLEKLRRFLITKIHSHLKHHFDNFFILGTFEIIAIALPILSKCMCCWRQQFNGNIFLIANIKINLKTSTIFVVASNKMKWLLLWFHMNLL